MKEHNHVKQDYATVKTTNETGVRTVDHLQRTFDYASEHAVESVVLAVGAVAAVALTVTVVPSVIAAVGALLATVSSVELIEGAVASTLIGISIFNDKGK